jgi:hypothetical protein
MDTDRTSWFPRLGPIRFEFHSHSILLVYHHVIRMHESRWPVPRFTIVVTGEQRLRTRMCHLSRATSHTKPQNGPWPDNHCTLFSAERSCQMWYTWISKRIQNFPLDY